MNFSPPLLPRQLSFEFVEPPECEPLTPWQRAGLGRSAYFARRKTLRAVALALELERRRQTVPRPRHAFRIPPRPFQPTPAEACELTAIAARLSRLTISRKDPHAFFEQRSELVYELRTIAGHHHARSHRQ